MCALSRPYEGQSATQSFEYLDWGCGWSRVSWRLLIGPFLVGKGSGRVLLVVTTLLGVQCLGAVVLLNTSLCLACFEVQDLPQHW